MTPENSKNGAITIPRMNLSESVRRVIIFRYSYLYLELELIVVTASLVVMRTYVYNFPLSLSLSRRTTAPKRR